MFNLVVTCKEMWERTHGSPPLWFGKGQFQRKKKKGEGEEEEDEPDDDIVHVITPDTAPLKYGRRGFLRVRNPFRGP
jgi:hypothetical protein